MPGAKEIRIDAASTIPPSRSLIAIGISWPVTSGLPGRLRQIVRIAAIDLPVAEAS
jgi:hypothetical protein